MRYEEAVALRRVIDARLDDNPRTESGGLGDFNDVKDSNRCERSWAAAHTFIRHAPRERNGDDPATSGKGQRIPQHHLDALLREKQDVYSRIDYILLSRGNGREWLKEEDYV